MLQQLYNYKLEYKNFSPKTIRKLNLFYTKRWAKKKVSLPHAAVVTSANSEYMFHWLNFPEIQLDKLSVQGGYGSQKEMLS